MAFTVSNFTGSYNSGTSVTSISTGSFTPTANGLMVLWFLGGVEADLTTVTGHSVTWTKAERADAAGGTAMALHAWWAATSGSPSADTVDITMGSQSCIVGVIEITGDVDTGSPIVQTKTAAAYNSPTDFGAAAWSPAITTGNLALALYGQNWNDSTWTPDNSFTSLTNQASPGTLYTVGIHYLESGADPQADTTQSFTEQATIAIEIAAAAAGGGDLLSAQSFFINP